MIPCHRAWRSLMLSLLVAGLAACSGLLYTIEKQHTDNVALPYRAQEIATKPGWTGQLERTLCRSAVPLPADPSIVCP